MISRQGVYLHFASRTELLVAATRYLDEVLDVDRRLAPSRAATTGAERLGGTAFDIEHDLSRSELAQSGEHDGPMLAIRKVVHSEPSKPVGRRVDP